MPGDCVVRFKFNPREIQDLISRNKYIHFCRMDFTRHHHQPWTCWRSDTGRPHDGRAGCSAATWSLDLGRGSQTLSFDLMQGTLQSTHTSGCSLPDLWCFLAKSLGKVSCFHFLPSFPKGLVYPMTKQAPDRGSWRSCSP